MAKQGDSLFSYRMDKAIFIHPNKETNNLTKGRCFMSIRFTKKETMGSYVCIETGYCRIQNLLHYENRIGYTKGINGWNADIYIFDNDKANVAIVTGYRPFGHFVPNYDLEKEYDTKAEKIIYGKDFSYDEKKEKVRELLYEFIEKATDANFRKH